MHTPEVEPQYIVVVNHEEQYSIWSAGRLLPPGWLDTGARGSREECLGHIRATWVDMRPRNLREGA